MVTENGQNVVPNVAQEIESEAGLVLTLLQLTEGHIVLGRQLKPNLATSIVQVREI